MAHLKADVPPGDGRSSNEKQRQQYWKTVTQKRTLVYGSLVCLVWMPDFREDPLFLVGLVNNREEDFKQSSADALCIRIAFLDRKCGLPDELSFECQPTLSLN